MFSSAESRSSKCVTSTLLYLSEDVTLDSRLRNCLTQAGFNLRSVTTEQEAINILFSSFAADAFVIYQDRIDAGSMIACACKSLCPQLPIILLSAQSPLSDELPLGVDALYYGNVRSYDAAPGIAGAIWQLVGRRGTMGGLVPVGNKAYPN